MKRFLFAAALCLASLASPGSPAQAMPRDPLTGLVTSPIEDVQYYVYGGRRYCFYPEGWRGPGYYWCGYAWRQGYGWGGPLGWRGWGPRVRGPRVYDRPRAYRPAPRARGGGHGHGHGPRR